ncbi:MAG: hypothetical protein R2879_02920 [Saprospiraceae bacterium]
MTTRSPFLTLLLVSSIFVSAMGQTERTLVKSFSADGITEAHINMDVPVEIISSNGNLIRVKMFVSLEGGNDKMLKTLVVTRRYDLRSTKDGSKLIIDAPALARKVEIGGKEVIENIRLEINVPEQITLTQDDVPALADELNSEGTR